MLLLCDIPMNKVFKVVIFFVAVSASNYAGADTIRVAVASNALAVSQELSALFSTKTGHKVTLSAASTGKLYAQIVNGAPYDVFMAANMREPMRLIDSGLAEKDSRMTYAIGRLVLYSTQLALQGRQAVDILKATSWQRMAIANPRTAPYGVAAKEVLQHLGLWDSVQVRLIRGENIGQAFYFTQSGNVDLGLVALSQIKSQSKKGSDEYASIPDAWYTPLKQQAVLLSRSQNKSVAKLFMTFIGSQQARKLLTEKYGYGVESK